MERNTTGNKFMKIITIPFRALGKARDMYVNGMNSYASKGCYGGGGGGGFGYSVADPLPRSFSTNSVRSSSNGSDDLRDLIRVASSRVHTDKVDPSALSRHPRQTANNNNNVVVVGGHVKRVPRSASVGMAKIEEDNPCEFEDDEGVRVRNGSGKKEKKKGSGLFPRSRSYAD